MRPDRLVGHSRCGPRGAGRWLMQIRVDVPVHVIIDADTAAAHLGHLDEALTDAAGRALRNAKGVVEGAVARRLEPVVSWTGSGLGALPAQARQDVETLVHGVLTTAGAATFPEAARIGQDG